MEYDRDMKCAGDEEEIHLQPTWNGTSKNKLGWQDPRGIQDCADKCHGVSSMFRYQVYVNDDPNLRDSIMCYCEKSATDEGTCQMERIVGFSIYKYINIGELLLIYAKEYLISKF